MDSKPYLFLFLKEFSVERLSPLEQRLQVAPVEDPQVGARVLDLIGGQPVRCHPLLVQMKLISELQHRWHVCGRRSHERTRTQTRVHKWGTVGLRLRLQLRERLRE